jgi:molecular chaperone DnaK (HSP70)
MANRWLARKKRFVGIDYGTTKCAVAILSGKETEPTLVPLTPQRERWSMPSVVTLWRSHSNSDIYSIDNIGMDALARSAGEIDGAKLKDFGRFERVKLALGRTMSKSRMLPQTIEEFSQIRPEDIAVLLLRDIRETLQKNGYLDTEATVTIPANWSPKQRRATKFAAHVAGFTDIELVEEPIAALSYIWKSRGETFNIGNPRENVLVVDFGGGTCDLAIVEIDNRNRSMQIQRIEGSNALGGELIDQLIISQAKKDPLFPQEPSGSYGAIFWRLKSQDTKIGLNDNYLVEATTNMPEGLDWKKFQPPGFWHIPESDVKITSHQLHKMLLDKCSDLANEDQEEGRSIIQTFDDLIGGIVTRNADLSVNRALVVGGSARLYFVKPIIRKYLPHLDDEKKLIVPEFPDQCIARGAAWHEKWRWGLLHRAPFKPKLFFSIEIPMANTTGSLPPVIRAPHDLPTTGRSYPFHLTTKGKSFTVVFRGNPRNTHPDEKVYNQVTLTAERDLELLPHKHDIQVTVNVSRDGVLDITAKEMNEHLALEYKDEFPLSGDEFRERVREIYSRIINLENFFREKNK